MAKALLQFYYKIYLFCLFISYKKFFDYLNSKIEHILSSSPFSEMIILGDFNVHHRQWFHLVLMIQPVNSPSTFLSRTTLSSWCNSLPVSLIVLVMNPTYLIFSLLLILLLIGLNSFLLWVHPITFLSPYLVLSLQVFQKNGDRLRQGDVSGISVKLTGLTCGFTFLIFHGMITVSVGGVTRSVQSA